MTHLRCATEMLATYGLFSDTRICRKFGFTYVGSRSRASGGKLKIVDTGVVIMVIIEGTVISNATDAKLDIQAIPVSLYDTGSASAILGGAMVHKGAAIAAAQHMRDYQADAGAFGVFSSDFSTWLVTLAGGKDIEFFGSSLGAMIAYILHGAVTTAGAVSHVWTIGCPAFVIGITGLTGFNYYAHISYGGHTVTDAMYDLTPLKRFGITNKPGVTVTVTPLVSGRFIERIFKGVNKGGVRGKIATILGSIMLHLAPIYQYVNWNSVTGAV